MVLSHFNVASIIKRMLTEHRNSITVASSGGSIQSPAVQKARLANIDAHSSNHSIFYYLDACMVLSHYNVALILKRMLAEQRKSITASSSGSSIKSPAVQQSSVAYIDA